MSFTEDELAVVDRLLTTTRSVRRRLDLTRPVPRDVILDCIRLATQAPTASNLQTWRFVVVTDPAQRARPGVIDRANARHFDLAPHCGVTSVPTLTLGARKFAGLTLAPEPSPPGVWPAMTLVSWP